MNPKGLFGMLARLAVVCAAGTWSACGVTLFQSNFSGTPVGDPPAPQQEVGTAEVLGPRGSALIIASQVPPAGKWVEISHPDPNAGIWGMQANLSEVRGPGDYNILATLFIPSTAGKATIAFLQSGNDPVQLFLHLDFMPNGQVRIDDVPSTDFGSFQHDQPFVVQVALHAAAQAHAHVVLSGATATGDAYYDIPTALWQATQQFSAVAIVMGAGNTGRFDSTNISVERLND